MYHEMTHKQKLLISDRISEQLFLSAHVYFVSPVAFMCETCVSTALSCEDLSRVRLSLQGQ